MRRDRLPSFYANDSAAYVAKGWHAGSRARLGLECGDPVGNTFIVDRRDRGRARLLGALLAGGHVRSPLDDRLFTGAGPPRNARRRSRPGSRKRGLSAKRSLTVAGMIRAAPDPTGTIGQFLHIGRQAIEFFKPPPLARPSTAYKAGRILVNSRNERAKARAISKHMVLIRKRDTR